MKQLKRLTSVLLVLGLVLGLMPLSAFAAEPAKKPFTKFTEVVDGNTYTYMPLDDDTVELTGFEPNTSTSRYLLSKILPRFSTQILSLRVSTSPFLTRRK